jgi:ribosomal 50S subunit-recycling heat shock protein
MPTLDNWTGERAKNGQRIYVGDRVSILVDDEKKVFQVVQIGGNYCLKTKFGCTYYMNEFDMGRFVLEANKVRDFMIE